jgi:hypothetical protein
MKPILTLAVVLALAGCAESPPVRYYALDPVAPNLPPVEVAGPPIIVRAVRLPAILDRLEMVRRGPGAVVVVSDLNRWAAPLDAMTQRVLAEDLADRLAPGQVIGPGQPKPPGKVRLLTVSGREFDARADGRVLLEVEWTLQSDDLLGQSERIEVATPQGQPEAMSQAVASLADSIVARLASQQTGEVPLTPMRGEPWR